METCFPLWERRVSHFLPLSALAASAMVSLRGTITSTRMRNPARMVFSTARGRANRTATTSLRSSSATMSKNELPPFLDLHQLTTVHLLQ